MKIAVIAVAYNRVDSLARLLHSLEKAYYPENESIPLIISIDKSNTDIVEHFADDYLWPHGDKIVDKHESNLGLRSHMMSLGKWFDYFDSIVVLEDDIVVSPNYYTYTKQAVNKYYNIPGIAGISLYSIELNYQTRTPFVPIKDEHDAYFMNCAMSWGEVWMRDSWRKFYDWYLEHQDFPILLHLPVQICEWSAKSWLKYHIRYCIEENEYFVHPYTSLASNYGDVGEHNDGSSKSLFQVSMQYGKKSGFILPDFDEKAVFYDGFFENKALYDVIGKSKEELCVDLNGMCHNNMHRRYWLTTEVKNYKVVRSFGLNYRPIEQNVLLNNAGETIFLYDTQVNERNKKRKNHELLFYHYRFNSMWEILRMYGIRDIIKLFVVKVCEKISKLLKKR